MKDQFHSFITCCVNGSSNGLLMRNHANLGVLGVVVLAAAIIAVVAGHEDDFTPPVCNSDVSTHPP